MEAGAAAESAAGELWTRAVEWDGGVGANGQAASSGSWGAAWWPDNADNAEVAGVKLACWYGQGYWCR